jgi:hypothetical protein
LVTRSAAIHVVNKNGDAEAVTNAKIENNAVLNNAYGCGITDMGGQAT